MPTSRSRFIATAAGAQRLDRRGANYQSLDRIVDVEMTAPTAASMPASTAGFHSLDAALRQRILQHLSSADLARLSMVNQAMYGAIQQPALWRQRIDNASSQVPACREILQMRGWKLSDLSKVSWPPPNGAPDPRDACCHQPGFAIPAAVLFSGGVGCLGASIDAGSSTACLATTGVSAWLGAVTSVVIPCVAQMGANYLEQEIAATSNAFERARADAVRTMADMDEPRQGGGQGSSAQDAAHVSSLRRYAKYLFRYNQPAALAMALNGAHLGMVEQLLPSMEAATELSSLAPPAVLSSVAVALIQAEKHEAAGLLIRRGASAATADPRGKRPDLLAQQRAQAAARAGRWDALEGLLALPITLHVASSHLPDSPPGPQNCHARVVAWLEHLIGRAETQQEARALCRLLAPTAERHRVCHTRLLADAILSGRMPVALALFDIGARLAADGRGDEARRAAEQRVARLEAAGRWSAAHRLGQLVAVG